MASNLPSAGFGKDQANFQRYHGTAGEHSQAQQEELDDGDWDEVYSPPLTWDDIYSHTPANGPDVTRTEAPNHYAPSEAASNAQTAYSQPGSFV